ncbi:hypothetical protein BDA99DRAFT_168047 [Phascolomyces articulosus]|uniref:F-box domain-containing protein n=1 Tax=Phascolomyces articulosus TaxID=60185 RepID=A0AAD5K3H2_9FUNG|nr:hypothetical protein BDA99DRAFT_168047 [Phascolomyces articulosus]
MSQDSVNALTDSISNINKALKEHDFDTIINETVLGIDELLPKIHMSFLEQRVMAFKRKGDVHQAYVTSLIMTREFPTFISGFLHAARILIQQRRFEHAIVMCKDGLEKNAQLSTKDPKYQELLQVQKLAQKGQNSKVDFMKLLPYDVITLVLKRLSMDDIINCMKVSKGWEQSILSCPSSFREWRIVPPADQREYDATEYDIIQQLSEHIWSLYVILQWEELAEQQIKNLFSNVTFPHLRSFTVYCTCKTR